MDPADQRLFVGIAHALFLDRLHLLRLTEIVRLGITPREDDGSLEVPPELDAQLQQQAVDYVRTCLPREVAHLLDEVEPTWLRPA